MNLTSLKKTIPFTVLLLIAVLFGPSSVNAVPYASGVKITGSTVSFVLNEGADSVKVVFNGGTSTNSLGALGKGSHSFSLGTATSFEIVVSKNAPIGWVQTSSDSSELVQFYSPKGLAVNGSATNVGLFGRVYVANSLAGTTTVTGSRTTGDGIYILNADLSDTFGQGSTARTAGIAFDTNTVSKAGPESPYRLRVGSDNRLYIADYSTNTGTIYRTDPDVSSHEVVLYGFGMENPTVHTTVGGVGMSGSQETGDLTIYGINGELPDEGDIWKWEIGASPLPYDFPATRLGSAGALGVAHLVWDLDWGPSGNLYTTFYRQNNAAPNLKVFSPDMTVLWDSLVNGGNPDPLMGSQGVKVSPDGQNIALVSYVNTAYVLPLTNGVPDMSGYFAIPAFPSSPGSASAQGVAWDAAGNLYVTSTGRQALRVFSLGGNTVARTGSDLTGTNGTFSITRPVLGDPELVLQPQSVTNNYGTTATFYVGASGTTPFSYQWYTNGTAVAGATTNSYSIANVQTNHSGMVFHAVVTNINGSLTSAPATLTVAWGAPVFTLQPQNVVTNAGTNALFTAQATGIPAPSYQWKYNGANIASQTGTSLARTNVQTSTMAGYYALVASNIFGVTTSSVATLTMIESLPIITIQPVGATTNVGANVAFRVTTIGTDTRAYQWQLLGTNIMGATGSAYTRNNVQQNTAGDYRVIVSNPMGAVTSSVAPLIVTDTAPIITAASANARTVSSGSNVLFSVTARGTDPRFYQWQFNGSDILMATNSTFTLTNAQADDIGTYSVTISNTLGTASTNLELVVNNTGVAIYLEPVSKTNGAGVDTVFTIGVWGDDPRTYQWSVNGVPVTGATSNSFTFINPQVVDSGASIYCVARNEVGGVPYEAGSAVATLTVTNRTPVIVVQPTNLVASIGGSATFSVFAQGEAPLSYQWRLGTNDIAGATGSAFSISNAQMSNAATNYNVVVTSSGGSTTSQNVQLAVTAGATPGTGIGLRGEYFANQYLAAVQGSNASLTIPPTLTRVDTNVDFLWATGVAPDPSIPENYFIVRWTGQIQPLYSQVYTLHTKSDDGVRLWFNNQLVIDQWKSGGNQNYSAVISNALVAGQKYDIRMEFVEISSGAEAHLMWSSDSQIKEPIATSQLYTNSGPYIIAISPTNRFMNVGTSANPAFTVYAGGTGPLSYQWWRNGSVMPGATGSALSLNSVQLSDAGTYSVVVTGPLGVTSNQFNVGLTVPASIVSGTGSGLTAQYFNAAYNNAWWFTNSPVLTRVDQTVHFDWGAGSPDVSVAANTFIGRWTGKVQPQLSEVYTFSIVSDDGARVWVDQQLIIDSWATGSTNVVRVGTMPYAFTAGQSYDIRVEFLEGTGAAQAHLYWSSLHQPEQIVPMTQLYPNSGAYVVAQTTNQTALAGSNVIFKVWAGGPGTLSYQWKKNGAPIGGATASDLTLSNLQSSDEASYTVMVSNAYGSASSTNATLTLNYPPMIITQPQTVGANIGDPVTFNVLASSPSPISYQWRFNGTNINGAVDSSYSIASVQSTDAGSYSVAVSNPYATVLSADALLMIGVVTPPVFSRPEVSGTNVVLNWSSTAGRTYRLQTKADLNATSWSDVAPDITASGSSITVTNGASGTQKFYRAIVLP